MLEIKDAAIADKLAAFVDEIRALYPLVTPPGGQDSGRSGISASVTRIAVLFLAVLALGVAVARRGAAVPGAPGCPVFPADERLEPARRQAAGRGRTRTAIVAAIGADDHLHADFGSGL